MSCCCCRLHAVLHFQEAEQERARSAATSRKMLTVAPADLSSALANQQQIIPPAVAAAREGFIKAARPGN